MGGVAAGGPEGVVILDDLALLFPVEVSVGLALFPGGAEPFGAAVAVADSHLGVDRLTHVDGTDRLVLADVGELVHDDGHVGTTMVAMAGHVDGVPGGKGAAPIDAEKKVEQRPFGDADVGVIDRPAAKDMVGVGNLIAGERRGVVEKPDEELEDVGDAEGLQDAGQQGQRPGSPGLGLFPEPVSQAIPAVAHQGSNRFGDEGNGAGQPFDDGDGHAPETAGEVEHEAGNGIPGFTQRVAQPAEDSGEDVGADVDRLLNFFANPFGRAANGAADGIDAPADLVRDPANPFTNRVDDVANLIADPTSGVTDGAADGINRITDPIEKAPLDFALGGLQLGFEGALDGLIALASLHLQQRLAL